MGDEAPTGAPRAPVPTHGWTSTNDALAIGVLRHDDGCSWIGHAGAGQAGLFPRGTDAVVDSAGTVVGLRHERIGCDVRVGELVQMDGSTDLDAESCLGASEAPG